MIQLPMNHILTIFNNSKDNENSLLGDVRKIQNICNIETFSDFINGDIYGVTFKNYSECVLNYHNTMDFFEVEPFLRSTPSSNMDAQQNEADKNYDEINRRLLETSEKLIDKIQVIRKNLRPNNMMSQAKLLKFRKLTKQQRRLLKQKNHLHEPTANNIITKSSQIQPLVVERDTAKIMTRSSKKLDLCSKVKNYHIDRLKQLEDKEVKNIKKMENPITKFISKNTKGRLDLDNQRTSKSNRQSGKDREKDESSVQKDNNFIRFNNDNDQQSSTSNLKLSPQFLQYQLLDSKQLSKMVFFEDISSSGIKNSEVNLGVCNDNTYQNVHLARKDEKLPNYFQFQYPPEDSYAFGLPKYREQDLTLNQNSYNHSSVSFKYLDSKFNISSNVDSLNPELSSNNLQMIKTMPSSPEIDHRNPYLSKTVKPVEKTKTRQGKRDVRSFITGTRSNQTKFM